MVHRWGAAVDAALEEEATATAATAAGGLRIGQRREGGVLGSLVSVLWAGLHRADDSVGKPRRQHRRLGVVKGQTEGLLNDSHWGREVDARPGDEVCLFLFFVLLLE